jgi:hypothetical protein
MTLEQFYETLEQTPREWAMDDDGMVRLRCPDSLPCPLNIVAGNTVLVSEAASALRLSQQNAWDIANAADATPGHDAKIRARLLKACGL